jgi:hypothetical protein
MMVTDTYNSPHNFCKQVSKVKPTQAFVLLLLCCLSIAHAWAQSPWTPKKGHGYAQMSFNLIGPYQSLFLANGESQTLSRKFNDITLQGYGEWGITNRTTLIAVIPWKILTSGEATNGNIPSIPSSTLSTFGNVELGFRRNFTQNKVVFSGQLMIEAPTGTFKEVSGLRSGYDAWAIVPTLSLGQGTDRLYGYVSAGTGVRNNHYSSDFRLNAEGGYKLFKKWWMIAVVNYRVSFKNGNVSFTDSNLQTGLYVNDQEYFAFGLKTIVELSPKWGLNGAAYGAGGGNYVAKSPSFNAGVYYKW